MTEDPKKLGVNVERMIKTRRGLVVAVSSKNEVEKMMNSADLRKKGYVVTERVKKRPMIMIYDVEKGQEEADILKEMYGRNFVEGMTEQEFLRAIKIRRKVKQQQRGGNREKTERETWIVEVNGKIFNSCMKRERIYMRWEALRVKKYVDVVRCFKCQGFGHVGKVCREKKQACGRCMGEHKTEGCEVEEDSVRCINCRRG